jgi:hypothetical protein
MSVTVIAPPVARGRIAARSTVAPATTNRGQGTMHPAVETGRTVLSLPSNGCALIASY